MDRKYIDEKINRVINDKLYMMRKIDDSRKELNIKKDEYETYRKLGSCSIICDTITNLPLSYKRWYIEYIKFIKLNNLDIVDILFQIGGTQLYDRSYLGFWVILECKFGHNFQITGENIDKKKRKSEKIKCKCCKSSGGEQICRSIFENIFKCKFVHMSSMVNLGKIKINRIELDGYNNNLKLAFEFNGKQHYEKNNYFHRNRSLDDQKDIDKYKYEICKKNNIMLIVIPYNDDDYKSYICNKLIKYYKLIDNYHNNLNLLRRIQKYIDNEYDESKYKEYEDYKYLSTYLEVDYYWNCEGASFSGQISDSSEIE